MKVSLNSSFKHVNISPFPVFPLYILMFWSGTSLLSYSLGFVIFNVGLSMKKQGFCLSFVIQYKTSFKTKT